MANLAKDFWSACMNGLENVYSKILNILSENSSEPMTTSCVLVMGVMLLLHFGLVFATLYFLQRKKEIPLEEPKKKFNLPYTALYSIARVERIIEEYKLKAMSCDNYRKLQLIKDAREQIKEIYKNWRKFEDDPALKPDEQNSEMSIFEAKFNRFLIEACARKDLFELFSRNSTSD